MPFSGISPDEDPVTIEEILEQIIDAGGPVKKRYYKRMTALHYAAHIAQVAGIEIIKPIIEKLVKLGADTGAKDRDGNIPINLVGDAETIAALMPIIGPSAESDMSPALHESLHLISSKQDEESPETLAILEIIPNIAKYEVEEYQGSVPFLSAAYAGNLTAVRYLAGNGYDIHIADKNKNLAIHNAAMNGHPETVKLLLSLGLNVNAINKRRETPLHMIAQSYMNTPKAIQTIRVLINSGADTALLDNYGDTPLACAISGRSIHYVQAFLDSGCNPDIPNKHGESPLLTAILLREIHISELLIRKGANINTRNKKGEGALHYASPNPALIQMLLKHNVDINIVDEDGYTPLHQCASNVCEGIDDEEAEAAVDILMNAGLSLLDKNNDGKTPIDMVKDSIEDSKNQSRVQRFLDHLQKL